MFKLLPLVHRLSQYERMVALAVTIAIAFYVAKP